MSERIAYVNGNYVAESLAHVSIFDRGFLFGDGVYEVAAVVEGALLDDDLHLDRLDRSLREISLENPMPRAQWTTMLREVAARNNVKEGLVYLQVTRGVAERDFAFPATVVPTVISYARNKTLLRDPNASGVPVVSVADLRWARRDIKSTSMLAQVLAKQQAKAAGAFEAFMHEYGIVTEGGSSNAYIVKNNTVITRSLSSAILSGITRHVIFDLVRENRIQVEERAFHLDELASADEAFLTSATTFVLPVTSIDGKKINGAEPGPVTLALRERYIARALEIARR